MGIEESSEECFKRLCQEGAPKFIKALENIKDACDKIESAKGIISYSQVGKMAMQLHNGPKPQSILNNPKHKDYIDARKLEYKSNNSNNTGVFENKTDTYPTEELDYKTRRYIDDLRQRNVMLESAMREFKQEVLHVSKEQPIDIGDVLATGTATQTQSETYNSISISEEALSALNKLLFELPKIIPTVELFEGKSLRLRTGEWVLNPAEYAEVMRIIKYKKVVQNK